MEEKLTIHVVLGALYLPDKKSRFLVYSCVNCSYLIKISMQKDDLKKALVTGGTRGIGASIAQTLLDAGYIVSVTGTKKEANTKNGLEYLACDFSNKEELNQFTNAIKKMEFSVLVNNAGTNKLGLLENYDVCDFEKIQLINVIAPFMLCQSVIPGMCKRGFGRIVNITSIFGVVSKEERSAYSASKFGLTGLNKALSLEVAKHNVLVNCLAPGFVETDLTQRILGEKGLKEVAKQVPMKRVAKPREIASVVRFLASEKNSYMTGATILVDGGYTCV